MTEPHVAVARALLGPVLALVGLAYATGLAILVTRLSDILRRRQTTRFYEDYVGGGSRAVERTTRQLANQFEFPVLFLVAIGFVVACGISENRLVILAWAYAGFRWCHWVVHLVPRLNRLWLRAPVFIASNMFLLAMWVDLTIAIKTAP